MNNVDNNRRKDLRVLNARNWMRKYSKMCTVFAIACSMGVVMASSTALADEVATQAGAGVQTQAAQKASDELGTDIIFDFDGDGDTDADDWSSYNEWIKFYRPFDFDLTVPGADGIGDDHFGGVQVTGGTQYLINKYNAPVKSIDDSIDVSKLASFYLTNVGLSTSVKSQSPWGTCWAFANTTSLESAVLHAQAEAKGVTVEELMEKGTGKPVFNTDDNHGVDLSELELSWYMYEPQTSGSQKGEGIQDLLPADNDHADQLFCGGWGSMGESFYASWQGIANEDEVPYRPSGISKENLENIIVNLTADVDSYKAKLAEEQNEDNKASLQKKIDQIQNCIDDISSSDNGVPTKPENKWIISDYQSDYDWAPKTEGNRKQICHINSMIYLPDANHLVPSTTTDKLVNTGFNEDYIVPMQQALVKYGEVQIGYSCSNRAYLNKEHTAYYCDAKETKVSHNVSVVGFDDNYPAENFATKSNDVSNLKNGAWLVKNSWGSNWGESGYFWLSYYDTSISTPCCFDVELPDENGEFKYDNNYQYDFNVHEANNQFIFRTKSADTTVANVFEAKGREDIKAVSVRAADTNTHADIAIYKLAAGEAANAFTDGRSPVWTGEKDFQLPGFYTVDLDTNIELHPGERFVVSENLSSDRNGEKGSFINLETNMAKETLLYRNTDTGEIIYAVKNADGTYKNDGNGHLINDPEHGEPIKLGAGMGYLNPTVVCNEGETFIKINTADGMKWITPDDLSKSYNEGNTFVFGNALIKAFTVNVDSEDKSTQTDDNVDDSTQTDDVVDDNKSDDKIEDNTSDKGTQTDKKDSSKKKGGKTTPTTGDPSMVVSGAAMAAAGLAAAGFGLKKKQD